MNTQDTNENMKSSLGVQARAKWSKEIKDENTTISRYNESCLNIFKKSCDIVLDPNPARQTTITVANFTDEAAWKNKDENVYIFVRNGAIMKIGGTRTGMKDRWGSYLCGHCVQERIAKKTQKPFVGKMSVTNAHLYHTIEKDLISARGEWSIWVWKLPTAQITVDILGVTTTLTAQTYHAYESRCMANFRKIAGHIPQLCHNSDPFYR